MNAAAPIAGWAVVVMLVSIAHPAALPAQGRTAPTPITRALDAERRGAFADAATLFAGILNEKAIDGAALAGLDRVLAASGRTAELIPRLGRALDLDSTNVGFLGLAVRTFALLGRPDSARRYAERWSRIEPADESPFREWAMAALDARDRVSAKAALELGRQRLGRPSALAPELAQVLFAEGDATGATREWLAAVKASPAYRISAVTLLGRAAATQRASVRAALTSDGSVEARRVHGLVLTRWGESIDGARLVIGALPTEPEAAIELLRAASEELRGRTDRASARARAELLEAVALRQRGAPAVRTRMDAARALADAGDETAARRLLAIVAADPDAPAGMATAASSTLLGVLLAEGKAEEAEQVLAELATSLDADERERQQRRVAMAYALGGNFARADTVIANDSSVAGFDVRGRVRLLQGDLAGAVVYFKLAGPYDDEREHAVERVTLLTLLQAVERDSLAAFGTIMMALERGDTAAAVAGLERIAHTLAPAGSAASRLLAGRLALGAHDTSSAERLLRGADVAEFPAIAAAARLALAQMDLVAGRHDAAKAMLERLILEFPESAVVPEARRLRDTLVGATPGATR